MFQAVRVQSSMPCAQCGVSCVMRAPNLPAPQQALFQSGMMRRRRLDAGTEIYGQGDGVGDFMIVTSGWVGLYKLLPDGGRQILKFALPGDLIGFSASGMRERDHSAVALTETTACVGSRALVHQAMRDPALIERIADSLVAEQAAIRDQMICIARQSALQRVAHLLIDLFARAQGHPPRAGEEMDLPLTQEQIGDALGLTAIHVNRMLGQLRQSGGAAVHRRIMRVLSPERLLELAEGVPVVMPKAQYVDGRMAPRARRAESLPAAA